MKSRERRRKRERECMSPVLLALVARITPRDDPSAPLRYLKTFATYRSSQGNDTEKGENNNNNNDSNDDNDDVFVITGDGLTRLCTELGEGVCSKDLLSIVRRVPRSQSTEWSIDVTEMCFAIGQAMAPVDVHERRRNVGSTAPIDESAPLLKYYKGDRFSALIRSNNSEEAEEEWKQFVKCLSSPLPMTLRVHRSETVLQYIANQFLQYDTKLREVLQPVSPFLPSCSGLYGCSHSAYHADPRLEYICRTLHAASAVSFQEAVSTLPVIVAGISPNHTVLDMCAAPGSKTLQVLDEMLKYGWSKSGVTQGVLVVNEKDRVKATQILPARLKKYHAPNVICMRCDAVQWPRLFFSSSNNENSFTEKRFDRIICDVPCSGDGTLRKEPGSASSWSSGYVKSLVSTQKALLRRGLDLLKEDGILVYSTCSLNPKEDEEIVCAGLELFGDTVELIDVNDILKKYGAVLQSSGGILSPNVDQLQGEKVPQSYDAQKVLRVLPHHDNTGGFFIAAFRKRSMPDWSPPLRLQEKLNQWTKGKLWAPVGKEDPVWKNIAEFYHFDINSSDAFYYFTNEKQNDENSTIEQGLVPVYHLNPNGSPCRRIVLLTLAAARMLFETRPYKGPGVEIVSAGVRAFEAYDGNYLSNALCRWRAVVESASYLAPFMRARKMIVDATQHPDLLHELLSKGSVRLQDHWRVLLRQAPEAATTGTLEVNVPVDTTNNTTSFFVRTPSPLSDILTSIEWKEPSNQEFQNILDENVVVGGVLIALVGGKLAGCESPWWLSATLSCTKLELAVDASLRAFGLLAFLGVDSNTIS